MSMAGNDLRGYRVGIYVRESRDDNEENYETIETQRDMLIDLVGSRKLGELVSVYIDDNVSGSAFEREGLDQLRREVLDGRIDLLLVKDLSRLGRNNAKTLLFLDFLEENGVRIMTGDGRYDSLRDNETVGIETWYNERYVRDISRKIRASLKFKIESGEYLGHAPYGYSKSDQKRNRLVPDEDEASVVRSIYRLYRSGLGYASVAKTLNGRGCPAPGGGAWTQTAVRRILCSRAYTGDTIQGVSEKISFKSKKTRRKPEENWVVTPDTHEPIIPREEFEEVRSIREGRAKPNLPHKNMLHPLRGLVYCGSCGSMMYARKRDNDRTAYICSKYYKKGSGSCTSHFIQESIILEVILQEVRAAVWDESAARELNNCPEAAALFRKDSGGRPDRIRSRLKTLQRQQEMLYSDRLEGRIGESLFGRMNSQLESKMEELLGEIRILDDRPKGMLKLEECISGIQEEISSLGTGYLTAEIVKLAVDRVVICDPGDAVPDGAWMFGDKSDGSKSGFIAVDFRLQKV